MCVLRATNCLYVILASTVFLFNILQYSAVTGSHVASSILTSNLNYIEIDHELVPRTIENINEMSPLPVPPGRNNSEMRKFPVSKRQIQRIILEIEENKGSNDINTYQPSRVSENESWKNESEIRKSKLKTVLGTDG
ncbi:unnamed protein product, partial [Meganyctiphanes norvegica]